MKNIFKSSLLLAITVTIGIMGQSCKSTEMGKNSNAQNISGNWIMKTFNSEDAKKTFPYRLPSLNINQENSDLNGYAGCNIITGGFKYNPSNGEFIADRVASTLMACQSGDAESDLLKKLSNTSKVSVIKDVLTFSQNGKVYAEYVIGIDSEFLRGKWTLSSMNGKDASALFDKGRMPTLEFDLKKQSINGYAGCNQYNATYSLDKNQITVGGVATTRMACPRMDGEALFVKSIEGVSSIRIVGNNIVLSKDGKETLRFSK